MEQDRAPAARSGENSGRTLALGLLRLVAVPALLVWILSQVSGAALSSAAMREPVWLAGGLVINQVALCVFAMRMQLVLRQFGVRIGWLDALRIHLQSMFYFFALPMTVGLELSRFFKIRSIQPAATVVQMSSALLVDRLLGAASALAVALLCLPVIEVSLTMQMPAWTWAATVAGAVALCAGLLLWPRARTLLRQAWDLARGRWLGLTGLFVLSAGMHVLFALGVLFVAWGLGLPLTFVDTLIAIAGGMLLVAIPVSFAGLGPAEAGTAGLLVLLGYTLPIALVAGALPYLLRLVGALEGAAWELFESGASTIEAARNLRTEPRASDT